MGTELPRLNVTDPIEDIVAALRGAGGVIVEDMLDPDTVGRLNAELDPLLDALPSERGYLNPMLEWFFGAQTRHIVAVTTKSKVFAHEVISHPTFMGVSDAILLPSCARYQLTLAHVLDRGAGSTAQLLHRDELVWVHMPKPPPELQ